MRRLLGLILAFSAVAAACGGKGATSPSETGATTPGGATGSATIAGAVQGALPASVAVSGTSVSSPVDPAGRFTLANVPSGDVQLQFSGGGASAMLPVAAVQPAQRIDLVVSVTGSSAAIESQVRSGGGGAELEGRVESLPPTPPSVDPLSFSAAGRLVKTDASTRFQDGSQSRTFADLRIGMRVHVKGTLSGDAINATLVELQNSQVDIPVEVNGVIDTLTGNAAAFQFKIGSRLIKGDTNTTFFGDGDTPDTFADLKDGVRVEVKGQQRDGFVYAVRIHINDDDGDDEPPDTSASIHGMLKAIGGAVPTLDLTVDTTIVHTSSSTTVKRRGDFQTLNELRVGQSLHVIGARRADGSLDARLIEIDDDPAGNEVEIEGSVGGLKGACPSVSFGINGYSINTNGLTTFDGLTCTAMKSGDKVKVNGKKQADGSVLATKVTKS
jgi:Domain of unknown function (DUF5666)